MPSTRLWDGRASAYMVCQGCDFRWAPQHDGPTRSSAKRAMEYVGRGRRGATWIRVPKGALGVFSWEKEGGLE